jgi:MFS family permease
MDAWGPVLVMGLLQSALAACLPWLIEHTGISAGGWALLMSAGMVPVLLGAPLWGRAVDQRGAHHVITLAAVSVLAGFGLILAVLLSGVTGELAAGWLLVARLMHGIGAGGVFPAAQRLATMGAAPEQWRVKLARLQVAVHGGRLVGPVLVTLAALTGVMPVLSFAGILALALVIASWQVTTVPSGAPRAPGDNRSLPWRTDWPLYLMALVLTTWVGVLQFVIGPVLTCIANVPAAVGATLTATALIIAAVIGLVAGPLVHSRVRSPRVLAACWFISFTGAGSLLLVADSVMLVYIGTGALALGIAILTPWYGTRLRLSHPGNQGAIGGRLTSLHTLGYIVGTLTGGWLLEQSPDNALAVFVILPPVLLLLAMLSEPVAGRHQTAG